VEVEVSAVAARARGVLRVGQRFTRALAEDLLARGKVLRRPPPLPY